MGRRKQGAAVAVAAAITPEEFRAALAGELEAKVEAVARLHLLTQAADEGDRAALGLVMAIHQAMPETWPTRNLLDDNIERSILRRLAQPEHLYIAEVIERQAAEMRAALLGPDPSSLERLLVGRVVLAWLASAQADLELHQCEGSPQRSEFLMRRADRADQRLMRAARTLATVRRLAGPSMQVNIAEEIKQVNVGR